MAMDSGPKERTIDSACMLNGGRTDHNDSSVGVCFHSIVRSVVVRDNTPHLLALHIHMVHVLHDLPLEDVSVHLGRCSIRHMLPHWTRQVSDMSTAAATLEMLEATVQQNGARGHLSAQKTFQ